jgi:demethylmenaquinone methyltransferase/2-methoxy-6-polyprenyl-1,4-benzoquinol methylase
MNEIKDALELKGDEIVIDIGGGTGRLAEYLSHSCSTVYILDESEGMLSMVKANPKVIAALGDALNTPFESSSFDVVIMSDVLHHIEKQPSLIREISRILKKNGKFLIMDFEKKHIKVKLLKAFEYTLFGRLYFRTGSEVIDLLSDEFKITKFIDNKYR